VNCIQAAPVTVELDPKVSTLTAGRWCTSNGTTVSCTQTAPVTTDKVWSNTLNIVPTWNGSALVDGSIFDDGTDVAVLGYLTVASSREMKEDIRDLEGNEATEALKD